MHPDRQQALDAAAESFEWYPRKGATIIGELAGWMAERNQDLGNYAYAGDMRSHHEEGLLQHVSLDYLVANNACVLGTPGECAEACQRYQAAGVDLLLCLVNPYKVPHDAVMQTIELMGKEVIPQFR